MRHTSEISAHTLIELERACADLRLVGAPDNTQVRMRVTAAMRTDGGHPRSLTGQWDPDSDNGRTARVVPQDNPRPRPWGVGPQDQ